MKVDIEVVKPNLQVIGDKVYFSLGHPSQFADAGAVIDEAVRKHIGELRVTQGDYKLAISNGREEEASAYTVPFSDYLRAIRQRLQLDPFRGIVTNTSNLFGLGYLALASTAENIDDANIWMRLKRILENPDEYFDDTEERNIKKGKIKEGY